MKKRSDKARLDWLLGVLEWEGDPRSSRWKIDKEMDREERVDAESRRGKA